MNILFRADSSSQIGTGHIMRDLVLAKQYKNDTIIFAVQDLEGNINYKIDEAKYKKNILKTNTLKELDSVIKELSIDMLVIDHYEINSSYEKELKKLNQKLIIMVLDDTYEKHYCDILLNHNINGNKFKYKGKVPSHCVLLCGEKYTLLRDEFLQEKKRFIPKKKIIYKNIFIAMGGADTANINIPILQTLTSFSNIHVDIVTTSANKHITQLKNYCRNKKWINLHINSTKIAKLLSRSNLAIITPSVTANEVYFIKVPFIAIKTASNQEDIYKFLKQKRYPVLNKFSKNKLENLLCKIL